MFLGDKVWHLQNWKNINACLDVDNESAKPEWQEVESDGRFDS